MSQATLSFNGVTKDFGSVRAVDDLSILLDAGKIFGLIGPNGSGKTTTLKMIAGLYRPTSGTILVNGIDAQERPTEVKRQVGYIPDDPVAYDRLTGREFLEFVGALYDIERGKRDARINGLLAAYGIGDLADGYFGKFSRGTKQKISTIAALMHEPSLLLIDEPMVGLDPRSIVVTKRLLRDYAAKGGAVLLSTHTLGIAEGLCDSFGILRKGKLVAQGSLAELREKAGMKRGSLESVFLRLSEGV